MADSSQISALIIDDEEISRRRVRRFLKKHPRVQVIGEAQDAQNGLQLIQSHQPDVLFLDIQLHDLDGFEILDRMDSDRPPYTIFITAYEQHAVRAFEVHAVDYLLKPFDQSRFDEAMRRAFDLLEKRKSSPQRKMYSDRLAVRDNGEILLIKVRDIRWIEAERHYCKLYTSSGKYWLREGINALDSRLDPVKFIRIHRSYIVNIDQVQKMQSLFHGEYRVTLADGTQLTLSRGFKSRLQELLGDKSF
jgi:two-component system LytT family response regulator